jgi:hypothetical protein
MFDVLRNVGEASSTAVNARGRIFPCRNADFLSQISGQQVVESSKEEERKRANTEPPFKGEV